MANILTRLLTLPFTLLSLIFTRILRFRGIPYLRLGWPGSSSANGSNGGDTNDGEVIIDPVQASRQFVRMLRTHAVEEGAVDERMWYTDGGYNGALRKAKEDKMILCVVLTCREHEDNEVFMRQALCTNAFKTLLQDHRDSIMLWGGEVTASRDAHIASTILQAATFPLVAFISLQPLAPSRISNTTSNLASTKMSVFSRLEGLQATSVPHLSAHINDTLLPRLGTFLNRLKGQRREREAQRMLREEQDRAYAEAGRRDLERVRAKEAELKALRETEERIKREELAKAREGANIDAWRKLTAGTFAAEPSAGLRLVIRLPDGRRLMRRFGEQESAKRVWEYVDCEAHGCSIPSSAAATSSLQRPDAGYQPMLSFALASTFPRRVLKLEEVNGKTLGQLVADGSLDKQGASLVVEGLTLPGKPGSPQEGEDEEEEEEEE